MNMVYLSWRDRHGSYHPLPQLGSGNCNWKRARWQEDSGFIEDMSLLPITGIRYGPLDGYYQEEINITVGALKCYPSPSLNKRYNITATVESLGQRLESLEQSTQQEGNDLKTQSRFTFSQTYCLTS